MDTVQTLSCTLSETTVTVLLSGEMPSLKKWQRIQSLLAQKIIILSPSNSTLYFIHCACPGTPKHLSCSTSVSMLKRKVTTCGLWRQVMRLHCVLFLHLQWTMWLSHNEMNGGWIKRTGKLGKGEFKAKRAVNHFPNPPHSRCWPPQDAAASPPAR